MTCGIYKITRKNTKQMYIGLSEDIEDRWYGHIYRPNLKHSYIDKAIRKYGADKFDLEIVEELPNDRPLLMEREAYWVAHYNTYEDDFHYNLTPGGDFSPSKLPEVRAKMSKAKSGKKLSQKTRKKMSKAKSGKRHYMYGKKHTQKTREKISKARNTTGYYRVYKQKGSQYKQGFTYKYLYYENGEHCAIYSVDLEKLEQKVKAKGLEWIKFDE